MSMIIAGGGGGAASVFSGEGQAAVHFSATGTGRVTGASVETQIQAVQNASSCNGGPPNATLINIPLNEPVTGGDFLAAAITLGGGAKVVSINDVVEGYDADVAILNPVGWWLLNEQSGNTAFDSGSGGNNGVATGGFTVGVPGPITGTPTDTAYQFYQYGGSVGTGSGALGTGLLGSSLLGDGAGSQDPGLVSLTPATDLQFGTTSFSIAGWINGTSTASDGNAYIFNSVAATGGASVVRAPLGWAIRGSGIMGGGILKVSSAGYALQMNEVTDRLEFVVSDNDGNTIAVQTSIGYGNTGWHFVVGVVNRISNEMSLYVDGGLIGNDNITGLGSVDNNATVPTLGEGLEGDLAQVFLTDYALTGAEIEQLYLDAPVVQSSNRWIQAAYSYDNTIGVGAEIWYARGVKPGVTVCNIQLTGSAASVTCCANVSEWSGIWYRDPLDTWSQNFGTSETVSTQSLQPRAGGELFIAAACAGEGLAGPASGYVPLAMPGGQGAAYYISPYQVAETTSWPAADSPWVTCHASFVSGEAGYNPLFQFPETLVEIATGTNYLAPLERVGVWRNISHYVEKMQLGPLGKQHLLDRADSSTANITVNNRRSGIFNSWNTESFLYGQLQPMHPVKVTSAWDGITSNKYYGYIQATTPHIIDALNVDTDIACNDILALLNLAYMSSTNYAVLIMADGGANLAAYYRLGDQVGSFAAIDSSGNGNTGSLVNGFNGEPTYGATSLMLYDATTSLDLTSGSNLPGGGVSTNDQTTSPPSIHDPLGAADHWSVEFWFQWLGGDAIPAPPIYPAVTINPISRPAGFPQGVYAGSGTASVVAPASYANVGDLAILGAAIASPEYTVSSITGTESGDWTLQVRNQDAANSICTDIWTATVAATASPDVLSISYSGDATPGSYLWFDSLTVGNNSDVAWQFPSIAVDQSNTDVTTMVYPAVDAISPTNGPQAYWGLGQSSGTTSAGGSSGFTYASLGGSQIVYNLDVATFDNPYQPTSPTTSGVFVTAGLIVNASSATASTAAIPNATLFRVNTPSNTEDFSAYEIQAGFAAVAPSYLQSAYIGNAIIEAFDGPSPLNIFKYASNPFDGRWHHILKTSAAGVLLLDGQQPIAWESFYGTQITNPIADCVLGTAPDGIGLDPNGGTIHAQPFTGLVEEFAMYTVELGAEQALSHYDTALWLQQSEIGAANGAASVARLNKVLAICGLNPEVILSVPYNFSTPLYSESDTVTTTSGLNYLQTESQTEPGLIFQGVDGYLYAYNREYQYLNPTSTESQATFSDSEDSPYFYDGPSLAIAGDDLDLYNTVQAQSGISATPTSYQIEVGVMQQWGPANSALAAYSASVYGNRTLQGLTALQFAYDTDALYMTQLYVATFAIPIQRVTQMTINAQGNGGANISQMLQRGLWDRLTIEYTGQTPGPTFSQDSLIESITDNVDMSIPSWSTQYSMSPYEILLPAFYLDSSLMDGADVLVL